MEQFLLLPPVTFILYLILVGILSGAGRLLAGVKAASAAKTSIYASGELHEEHPGAMGYRTFFIIALFFAVVHLGVLMIGTSDLSPVAGVYLVGLMVALLALILG